MIQKDIQRWKLLKAIYDATDGKTENPVECYEIASSLGYSREATKELIKFLTDSHLVNDKSYGEVALSFLGVKEVEKMTKFPERATDHFPANISNMESMHGDEIAKKDSEEKPQYSAKELNDLLDSLDYLLINIQLSESLFKFSYIK